MEPWYKEVRYNKILLYQGNFAGPKVLVIKKFHCNSKVSTPSNSWIITICWWYCILLFTSFSFSLLLRFIGSLAIDVSTLYTSLSNSMKVCQTSYSHEGHKTLIISSHLILTLPFSTQPRLTITFSSKHQRTGNLVHLISGGSTWFSFGSPVRLRVENLILSQTARRTQNTSCHWIPY